MYLGLYYLLGFYSILIYTGFEYCAQSYHLAEF
jgi:TRAP-type mannitol/chloroaromatic compound transport system permease small subunit